MSVTLHTTVGDIKIKLFCEECPKTCENFLALCASGYYKNNIFHRNIKDFMVQTGDPTGTGKGGNSIWEEPFEDEFRPDLKHDQKGILSMANNGPNTNKSQFFITFAKQPHLDLKYNIFGRTSSLLNRLAEAAHRENDPNATALMNQTISLPTGIEDRAQSPGLVLSDELTIHKIQIVVSLLKTGKFRQMNPYLKDIYSTLVPTCFRLNDQEARTWALESTAIMCAMDEKMTTGSFGLVWKAFVNDDISSMDGVCDLVIQYHYQQAKSWINDEEITELYRDILKNPFPKEATAHIVLYEGLVHMIPHVVDSEDFLKFFCRSIQKLDLDDAEMTLIDGSMTTINGIDDAGKKADEELTKLLKKLAFLEKTVEKEKEEENDDVAPLPLKTPAPKRRGRALKAVKCDSTLLMTPEGSSSPVVKREMSTRTRLPRTAKKTCTYNE